MKPLAERMRPRTLDQYIGQEHLVGANGPIRKAIEKNQIQSMIFWGPPGVGKTTLALLMAEVMDRPYFALTAINAGVKDVRAVIEKAEKQQFFDRPAPILFIDEIHRFSKSQQDALLKAVEIGTVILIGATTENPSFEVISALLSRSQVYILKHLEEADLIKMVDSAIQNDVYLKKLAFTIEEYDSLLRISAGDGRKLYNAIELLAQLLEDEGKVHLTNEKVEAVIQQNLMRYDKSGEQHYDIISAFIKSIRGSDPNGAVYWLARMIEGGEELKFICRRLIILASEDIGLANPNALLLATNTLQAVHTVGYPESRIILSQCAIYLANSPKSNSAYAAISAAQALVKQTGDLPVPLHLRNAPTKLMKELDYGKSYKYSHEYEQNFAAQEFLPEELSGTSVYKSGENAAESKQRARLLKLWKDKYRF